MQDNQKKNLKNSLILLPDGSVLKKSAVVTMEKRGALPEYKLGPAVIFRFQFGDRGGDRVVEFANEGDRVVLWENAGGC